jgi:hypothetical protein
MQIRIVRNLDNMDIFLNLRKALCDIDHRGPSIFFKGIAEAVLNRAQDLLVAPY